MADPDPALTEAVALYERELERLAAQRKLADDDYTVDDRGPRWTEAATGPGSPSR